MMRIPAGRERGRRARRFPARRDGVLRAGLVDGAFPRRGPSGHPQQGPLGQAASSTDCVFPGMIPVLYPW